MLLLHDVRLRLIQSRRADQGGGHTPDLRPVTDLCGDALGGEGGQDGGYTGRVVQGRGATARETALPGQASPEHTRR
jgi:hypothetical protein